MHRLLAIRERDRPSTRGKELGRDCDRARARAGAGREQLDECALRRRIVRNIDIADSTDLKPGSSPPPPLSRHPSRG
jgi:hypothetical protein